MNWVLMYLSMFFTTHVQTGMHTTGPFVDEAACTIYAEQTWQEPEWQKEEDGQNFYDSKSTIHHLEHNNSNMAIFWTCVKIRNPDEWREN